MAFCSVSFCVYIYIYIHVIYWVYERQGHGRHINQNKQCVMAVKTLPMTWHDPSRRKHTSAPNRISNPGLVLTAKRHCITPQHVRRCILYDGGSFLLEQEGGKPSTAFCSLVRQKLLGISVDISVRSSIVANLSRLSGSFSLTDFGLVLRCSLALFSPELGDRLGGLL